MKKMIRMDEYCSSVRDGTHDTPNPTTIGKYLVTSRAIKNNTIDYDECYYITQFDFDKVNKRSKVEQWDVIMTMIGTVGRLHIVNEVPDYAIKNIVLFKIGNENRAKWLYYYLSINEIQNYFEMIASGTSQHFIGLGQLRKLKIVDWNNNSWQIIDILSQYDNLIETNNKKIKVLEQMAEELYRYKFKYNKKSQLIRLGEIIDYSRGVSYSTEEIECDDGINLINLKNIEAFGGFRKDGIKKYNGKYNQKQIVKCGDIVMGITDMTQDRRTVGYAALVPFTEDKSVISADLIKINSDYNNYFLYSMFTYGNVSKYISQFANGSNVLHLRPDVVMKIKIFKPNIELVKEYSALVKPIFEEINIINMQNDNLIKQRDLLLPRLMSGKLEIK